jgi:hypothetical protein
VAILDLKKFMIEPKTEDCVFIRYAYNSNTF